ncbi:hypothetical protein HU230_0026945 [Bradyrhizobium quebecense]|nr:hypothetical protein HU230_0026945 [Bradyrhizobium quebecense]
MGYCHERRRLRL